MTSRPSRWAAGFALVAAAIGAALVVSAGADSPSEERGARARIEARPDLDGDGHRDRVTLVPKGDDGADWRVVAHLAEGRTVRTTLLADTPAAWAVDVDDDGTDELLVRTGGNTWTIGTLIVLDGGRLSHATTTDTHEDFFGWWAHSNCCPGDTADVACGARVGRPGLAVISSFLVPDGWAGGAPPERDPAAPQPEWRRRAWQRTVYDLDGASLVPALSDDGVIEPGAQPPAGVPLDNGLRCDAAEDA